MTALHTLESAAVHAAVLAVAILAALAVAYMALVALVGARAEQARIRRQLRDSDGR